MSCFLQITDRAEGDIFNFGASLLSGNSQTWEYNSARDIFILSSTDLQIFCESDGQNRPLLHRVSHFTSLSPIAWFRSSLEMVAIIAVLEFFDALTLDQKLSRLQHIMCGGHLCGPQQFDDIAWDPDVL
jgi:hypothetical protein